MHDLSVLKAERRRSAAQVLRAIADEATGEKISCREIVAGLGDRSFGILIVLFSLPNCVPAPPGLGSILGLPVFLIALQMVLGYEVPWLPKRVLDRRIDTATYRKVMDLAEPRLVFIEKLIRPRGADFFKPVTERIIGFLIMFLSVVVMLPFPLTNLVPAIASLIIALAMIERDAVALVVGILVGAAGTFLAGGVLLAVVKMALAAAGSFVD